jgi:RNA polymerase sigma-70 factor (ECF subfamily)
MVPADSGVEEPTAAAAGLDAESAEWLQALAGTGRRREAALARLHEMLVRIARGAVRRRGPRLRITGPELDDLAYQAAADALVAITSKLGQFRGESRFTTWAYKFVIFEVSAKIGRHFWRHPGVPLDAEEWDRLPDRFGFDPAREAEWRDLLAALHRAVDEKLTARHHDSCHGSLLGPGIVQSCGRHHRRRAERQRRPTPPMSVSRRRPSPGDTRRGFSSHTSQNVARLICGGV